MEDFFKELNLLDEYLNNGYLKEKNHFMGLDMLKIQVEKNLKKLKDLLEANEISKEIYDLAIKEEMNNLKYHVNGITTDGQVLITLTNTLKDIWVIVHENMHKIYHQPYEEEYDSDKYYWKEYFSTQFLFETPPILAEFLLNDYLERKELDNKNEILITRFNATRENMAQFHFEMILIKLYNKYHQITEEKIEEELQKEEEPLKSELLNQKQTYIENFGHATICLPYIFGLIVACTLKEKVMMNPEILNDIGKFIYDDNLVEHLEYLGIDFDKE